VTDRATRMLAACRGEPVDTTPIWIMRQAGRYLPEYRATRARARDFLTLCKTPELACEVTLQPVDLLGVDAAIIFSDILIPLEAMGIPLTFTDGEGPRLEPVRSAADVARLRVPVADEATGFVMDAIRLTARALDGKVPLIGFAGAPWTLMSYAVEGKTGKNFLDSKRLLFADPALAHALLDKITACTIDYLAAQVRAGARLLQLFDSWAGALAPDEYRAFALPYARRVVDALRPSGVPFIYFCNEGATLLADAATSGAGVLGIDFRVPLDQARAIVGNQLTLQGNLDPCALFAQPAEIERRAADILRRAGRTRHVFNLGHGILPPTPVEHAQALVEIVHRLGST
jgi:uroporphyrinogen decarboxylase